MSQQNLPPAAPTPGPVPDQVQEAPLKNSTLGLIALVVSAVGFVFACIPGALIVGWILLPIAFILSLVSLFQKGKKTFGIAALTVSIVGTIVGIVVFMSVVSSAVDETFGGSEVTVGQSGEPSEDEDAATEDADTDGEDADTEGAEGPAGSRANPVPLGTPITSDAWEVVVDSVNQDGTQAVMDANPFNEPPAEGSKYIVVQLTATNLSSEPAYNVEVSVAFVVDAGEVFNSSDSFAVPPEPAFGLSELYEGGTSTGNLVIEVPQDASGFLRVRPGMLADEVFVALN